MKIRKVNIQAFRLFDDVTVDLTARNNPDKAANLVAIYAPNGFGKTSFFDAMEFCVTKSIHRVRSNFKENFTIDQKQGATTFIHNKELPQKSIDISMSFEDMNDIRMTCLPNEECGLLSSDANINHKYFRDAILSQDWLSEFLSTRSAVDRFEIFMENFEETSRLLDYYKALGKASKSIGIELGKKRRELKQLQKLISKSLSADVLQKINAESNRIQLLGVNVEWQENEEKSFSSKKIECETIVAKLSVEYEKIIQFELYVDKSKAGEDGYLNIGEIEKYRQQYEKVKADLEKCSIRLKEIKKIKELQAQINQYQQKLIDLSKQMESYLFLISKYDEYCKLRDKKNRIYNDGKNLTLKQKKALSEINELNLSLEHLIKDITRIKELKVTNETALSELHERYGKANALQVLLLQNTGKLFEEEKNLEKKRGELKDKDEELSKLATLRSKVGKGEELLIIGVFESYIKRLIELSGKQHDKITELEKIKQQIAEKVKYEDALQKLLASSQNVIIHLKGGKCPLCGFDYQEYETLLRHVNDNTVLSDSLKEDEERRHKITSEIIDIKSQQENAISDLILKIDHQYNVVNHERDKILNVIKSLELSIIKLRKEKHENEECINTKYSDLLSVSESERRQGYESLVSRYTLSLNSLRIEESNQNNRKHQLVKEVEAISQKIISLSEEQSKLELDEFYQKYSVAISDIELTDKTVEVWIEAKDKLLTEEKKIKGLIAECMTKLENLNGKRVNVEGELVWRQMQDSLTSQYTEMNNRFSKTIHFLIAECGASELVKRTDNNSIIEAYDKIQRDTANYRKEIENKLQLIHEFIKLLEIGEKYVENEKNKKEYDTLLKNVKSIDNNKTIIDNEKDKLQKYLEDFIAGFFQLDIINKLYNTIDPHPEYKKISFECDFSRKDPRLNILIFSEQGNKDSIVPNLYFSTAQINILAFCIFMAKALFAKTDTGDDLGCIFIDDPIQALDDINILSMIDLLRNVAFSLDKQIVLTTHDKDFFELLKTKVPDRLFNSRFIEFKERGVLE